MAIRDCCRDDLFEHPKKVANLCKNNSNEIVWFLF